MMFLTSVSILLALAPFSLAAPTPSQEQQKANITDVDILQYALTLEHLEDKFYREGLANFTLQHFMEAGFNETFYNNIKEVSYDETSHVKFLTAALKSVNATPVDECTYAFGVTDVKTFIATASILEGVGVSAYLGAAASIMNKDYLTAAGSILTVESRHNAYIRAGLKQSPFPQAFDAPLDFNEVYTLAAPFIKSCPASNGMLPVKAFPALALDASTAMAKTNSSILINTKGCTFSDTKAKLFAAWVSVTGPTFVPAEITSSTQVKTSVPMGFNGQSYVLLTSKEGCMTDDCVLAGPAIVEVQGSQGGN